MTIERYNGTGRMSRAVKYNNTLYLCGQVSGDSENVGEQTKGVLQKIEQLLTQQGSNKNSILSVTVYLRDMKDFAAMNEVWDNWVENGNEPARACVEARLASANLLVEMSVIAAVE